MKRKRIVFFIVIYIMAVGAVYAQTAHFKYFKYQGRDVRFEKEIEPSHQYFNPVISGYYPDSSVCKVGDTYYLVNSSFAYFPGIPIFKSTDLVNWKQIGHVLDRKSQLNLDGMSVSSGIFAPQISYNPHNQTFYVTTMNMGEKNVFYVKSKNPSKGWSEPIKMKHGGMDTSFFFDTNGKAYVVYNTRPFGGQKYEGQMAIHMNEFDWKGDSVKSKTYELTTGSKCVDKPIWIEGPHLYRVGKYYYLMCAENGTGYQHSEVIFRSKNLFGLWEECPYNPILTQRDLPQDRLEPVTSTGHADLIQTSNHEWWSTFLGCRPYTQDYYNTGRETFLLPVKWENGWPVILDKGKPVPTVVEKNNLKPQTFASQVTGNVIFTDDFSSEALNPRWVFLRNPQMENYIWNQNGLQVKATATNLDGAQSPSALFCRQKNTSFTVETECTFVSRSKEELAGVTLFQNEKNHFVLGITYLEDKPSIILEHTEQGKKVLIANTFLSDNNALSPIKLKIEGDGGYYSFAYAVGRDAWQTLAKGVDARNLSTHIAGGFVGTMIGLYATTLHECNK